MIFHRQYGWTIIENLVVYIFVGNILGCAKDIESLLFLQLYGEFWNQCHYMGNKYMCQYIVIFYHYWEYLGLRIVTRTTYKCVIIGILVVSAIVGRILRIRVIQYKKFVVSCLFWDILE